MTDQATETDAVQLDFCPRCVDRLRTCPECDGSGYSPDGITETWED